MKINIKTRIPGPKSTAILKQEQKLNGGWTTAYPYVHSSKGKGVYFQDVDGNTYLDFSSQICANPLGYNHPAILKTVQKYSKRAPHKFAGADFAVQETTELIKELTSITPKHMNAAFLINSGAEAVENCMKIAMRMQPTAKYCISFEGAFHGRTLGALSLTNSQSYHKGQFLRLPSLRLPIDSADTALERAIHQEGGSKDIAFVILEHMQGEGGYRIPDKKIVQNIRKICTKEKIPYIADEVQAGMGRTGEWWAFQHFDIEPDIMSAAKALNVGAAITNRKNFPNPGAISSTWGGGHVLDLAVGLTTIKTIKKENLLQKNKKNGEYMRKQLRELEQEGLLTNVRGLGMMNAFNLANKNDRNNFIVEAVKNGLVLLGCGVNGIRVIPPYIITEKEIDEGIAIIRKTAKTIQKKGFTHTGTICNYATCGEHIT